MSKIDIDLDSPEAQQLDELVGRLAELGWTADEIAARIIETYRQMEAIEDR